MAGLVMTTLPGGSWGGYSVCLGGLVVFADFPVVFEPPVSSGSEDSVRPAVLKSEVMGPLRFVEVGVGVSGAWDVGVDVVSGGKKFCGQRTSFVILRECYV